MKPQQRLNFVALSAGLLISPATVLADDHTTIETLQERIEKLEQQVQAQSDSSSTILVEKPKEGEGEALSADLVVFGTFRGSLNSNEDDLDTLGDAGTQDGLSFRNNSSVLGLRGELAKGDYKAFFKYLLRSHSDAVFGGGSLQSLYYYAGVAGPFGSLQAGVQNHPYKAPALTIDPFYDTSTTYFAAQQFEAGNRGWDGTNIGFSNMSMGFTDNVIAYTSPAFAGFTIDASAILDDSNADEHDYTVGFNYSGGPFRGGVQHIILAPPQPGNGGVAFSPGEGNGTRVWGEVKHGPFSIAANYETIELDETPDFDEDHYAILGNYQVNKRLKLSASYGDSDAPNPETAFRSGDGYSLGAFYNLLPNFKVWSIWHELNRDDNTDRSLLSLGMEYSFAWKQALR